MKVSTKKNEVVRMGIDISKNLFQLHGVDCHDKPVLLRKVTRKKFPALMINIPKCLIGMEACGSAHYWARQLEQYGHTVKLIAAQHVKPYVQNNKNDARDAEAICEALSRPRMRFVEVKSIEQQDVQMMHRIRLNIVKARTAQSNQIRGLLAEYGIVIKVGAANVRKAIPGILEDAENRLSGMARECLSDLYEYLCQLDIRLESIDQKIMVFYKSSPQCTLLTMIAGIGPLCATALYAAVGNGSQFKTGRDMAAWLGLVPRQYSTAGRQVNLGISKRGNRYLRSLMVHGARSVVRYSANKEDGTSRWLQRLQAEKGTNQAAVAFANKMARIAKAVLKTGQPYKIAA
jgi:transposase